MADRFSIVVADDHPVFRQGLRQIIASESDFEIVGEASDGKQALDLIRKLKPNVAVLDMSMPERDGLSVKLASNVECVVASIPQTWKSFGPFYRDD